MALLKRLLINVAGTAEAFQMPFSIIHNPAGPDDDDFKTRQILELDRLLTAIALVERMRQAGISCELSNDPKNGH
jgi:hypothetical protein